jgi:hypothetical protein
VDCHFAQTDRSVEVQGIRSSGSDDEIILDFPIGEPMTGTAYHDLRTSSLKFGRGVERSSDGSR